MQTNNLLARNTLGKGGAIKYFLGILKMDIHVPVDQVHF